MSFVDIMILAVLGYSIFVGIKSGLIRQIINLVGIFVSMAVAAKYYHAAGQVVSSYFAIPAVLCDFVGFGVATLLMSIVIAVIGYVLELLFKATLLKTVNKTAGGVFGFLRGSLIVCILLYILTAIPAISVSSAVSTSNFAPVFISATPKLFSVMEILLPWQMPPALSAMGSSSLLKNEQTNPKTKALAEKVVQGLLAKPEMVKEISGGSTPITDELIKKIMADPALQKKVLEALASAKMQNAK